MMRLLAALALCLFLWSGRSAAQTAPDPVNLTAIWYDQSEQGYGVNVVHQGSILFVAWYTYGSDGKILWLLSAATRQADGRYVGPISSFNGQPFNQISNAQSWTTTATLGEARLAIGADGKLDFGYTVNGITQSKRLEKVSFVANPPSCTFTTASRASATNYTDIWWKDNESGWGLSMIHQGDSIFIAWYTYGSDGKPMWVTGLASRQADGSYTGSLNRPAGGTPFNQINGPATTFPIPTVGSFRLSFIDGERGTFDYTLDNITQSKPISRFVFVGAGTPVTVCGSTGGGGNPGGTLSSCDPGLNTGDVRVSRLDGNQVTERVVGPGTFQGQSVIIMEQFDQANVLTGRNYMQVTPTEIRTLASEGFSNGTLATTTVFNPPALFRRAPAVGESYTHSYVGTQSGPLLPITVTINYQETIRREADEREDVPAGSFNACKFKRDIAISTMGFGTSVSMDLWIAPPVGTIRSDNRTSTPQGVTNGRLELIRATVNGVNYGN